MRFVAHYIIYNGKIYKEHNCLIFNNIVTLESFEVETASTLFINGIVVIGSHELEKLRSDINLIISGDTNEALIQLVELFKYNNLIHSQGNEICVIYEK
ncbi:MAG: hypothetical protein PHR45_08470 [Muribaculaceae bacterium]|nr:hypothetical protein [Muribaculaceae bacterium]